MLDAKVVANLLPKLGVGVDLVRHGNWFLVKDSCVAEKGSWQGLDGIVDRPLCCECAPRPSEGTPKDGPHLLLFVISRGRADSV